LARCLWRGEIRTGGATTRLKTSTGCADSELVNVSGVLRRAMDSPSIIYMPRPDTTPEAEVNALASIYRFLLLEKGDRHDLMNATAVGTEGANLAKKGNDSYVHC
jgi:hypothetical protein